MRRAISNLVTVLVVVSMMIVATPTPSSAAGPSWWNASYSFRVNLAVTTTDATASGYSVGVTVNHATMVANSQALTSGNDLRVVYFNGTSWTELDRLVDPSSSWNNASTKIWFRTQTAIGASTTNTSYWLYFGNPAAASPPANGNNIFDVYDDFSGGSLNTSKWWTYEPEGSVDAAQGGGKLNLSGTASNTHKYDVVQIGTMNGYSNSAGGFAVESTLATSATLGANTQNTWKAFAGLYSPQLYLDRSRSTSLSVGHRNSGTFYPLGSTTMTGATITSTRLKTTFATSGTSTWWENNTLRATRTSTPSDGGTALLGFGPGTEDEFFDVSFDDVWVRKFVATEPTVAINNSAPSSPTSLGQFKADGTTSITTGAWTNSSSVVFKASTSDPDSGDDSALCIELQPAATPFTNTETSCGSSVTSGTTATHTLSVSDGVSYHWQARTRDTAGAYSPWVTFNSGSMAFGSDATAPSAGTVYDGTVSGTQQRVGTTSLSQLSANWSGFSDSASGISSYSYSIGTSAGNTDIKGWTSNGSSTSVTATGLTLMTSQTYFFNVRATDAAENVSATQSSPGQSVAPQLAFSISSSSISLGNANAGNSYTMAGTSTVTTSTNAYNGYVVRMYATQTPTSGGGKTVANTMPGTWSSPTAWSGYGFGYTSNDTNVAASNRFSSGSAYAVVPIGGLGDIVADHPGPITGTAINNESFDINFRLTSPSNQAAGQYATTIVYSVTPGF